MDLLVLDFETAYAKDYGLTKLTTEEYINGERFQVIGVAVKYNDEPTVWYTGDKDYLTDVLNQYDWDAITLVAHNCFFDASILSLYFDIFPKRYIDTLSMARAIGCPSVSLANLAILYQLGVKGTEVLDAKGKWLDDFTKQELDAYGSYCINDVDLTYTLLQKLLPHFSTNELSLIDITIRMGVVPRLELDTEVIESYLFELKDKKAKLLAKLNVDKTVLNSNKQFAELLIAQGAVPPMKLSATTGKMTYAFAKTDKGLQALLEHSNPAVQVLVEARLGIKSSIEETRAERYLGIARRCGALPIPLNYYGAATGRWAAGSGQKVNFQNISRGSKIKEAIIAPGGFVVVGADLSNIELRVGMWVAGEWEALHQLKEGIDLYKEFAAKVFNIPVQSVNKEQRFIGKASQLSLIFGVAHARLREAIRAGSGDDIGELEAKRIVELYRSTYKRVVAMWSNGDNAIKHITNNTHFDFSIFHVEGNKGIRLPSGLYMKYPELRKTVDPNTNRSDYLYKTTRGVDKIYGAKIFNNIVQGTARCILGEALVRVSKRYDVVLNIHDALYILAPEAEAEEALAFLIDEMTKVPAWMPDIPLDAEGSFGKSLKEAG